MGVFYVVNQLNKLRRYPYELQIADTYPSNDSVNEEWMKWVVWRAVLFTMYVVKSNFFRPGIRGSQQWFLLPPTTHCSLYRRSTAVTSIASVSITTVDRFQLIHADYANDVMDTRFDEINIPPP